MTRRIVHILLLFAGLAPAVWAICIVGEDARRAAVLAALAALGLGVNGAALARPRFGIGSALRLIACGVALIVLAGVMAMWHWIREEYLPGLPPADAARRKMALTASGNLLWIAGAVAYVLATALVLPRPAARTEATTGKAAGRGNARKIGR